MILIILELAYRCIAVVVALKKTVAAPVVMSCAWVVVHGCHWSAEDDGWLAWFDGGILLTSTLCSSLSCISLSPASSFKISLPRTWSMMTLALRTNAARMSTTLLVSSKSQRCLISCRLFMLISQLVFVSFGEMDFFGHYLYYISDQLYG